MIISPITFCGCPLKKLYKQGKIKVEFGLYGEKLTPKNVTNEHLLPRCYGGKTELNNIALAAIETNWRRGCQPIENFLTMGMLRNYCKQFRGVKLKNFDGDEYVKGIKNTIRKLVEDDSVL